MCAQVGNLLASMHIRPQDLPAALSHAHDASWHDVWNQQQQQQQQGPGVAAASLAAELAAGGAAAAQQQWEQIWSGGRAAGPNGAGPHAAM